jgi:hypothetical protein
VRSASSTPPLEVALRPVHVVAFVEEVGHPYADDLRGRRQLETTLAQQPHGLPERFVRFPQPALLRAHLGVHHHGRYLT